ncbi:MAG: hypothetical protein ACTSR2_08875, partial [Candidatus Hodarchaeales archaeon]
SIINTITGIVLILWTYYLVFKIGSQKINLKNFFFGLIGFGFAAIIFFVSICAFFYVAYFYAASNLVSTRHIIGGVLTFLTGITLTYLTYLLIQKKKVHSKSKKIFVSLIGFGTAVYWLIESVFTFFYLEMSSFAIMIIRSLIAIVLAYWTYLIIKKK